MMKRILLTYCLMVLACSLFAQRGIYLVEAEAFQFKGGWQTERNNACLGNSMLRVIGGKQAAADALTVVDVREKGHYAVWVRSADFKEKPGTRLFRLLVNEKELNEAGKHGVEGFAWEKTGSIDLEPGQVLLRLNDTKKNFARCDAVLLSNDAAFDPNTKQAEELAAFRKAPVAVEAVSGAAPAVSPYLMVLTDAPTIASVGNDKLRLRFVQGGPGKNSIVAKTEYHTESGWKSINHLVEDHKVYLLYSDDPSITFGSFFPSWNGSKSRSYFMFNDQKIDMQESGDLMNPFMAGELSEAIPVEVSKLNEQSILVKYLTKNGSEIMGVWSVEGQHTHVSVKLQCKAAKPGYYSIGLAAFQGIAAERVTNIQLPPMFQYKRISPKPVMLVSAMMQQPMAIAETKMGGGLLSTFISGDLSSFPMEWGMSQSSPMGFAIKNESNAVQPVAFAPVLGLDGSKLSQGQTIQKSFNLGIIPAGWENALEYISEQVYKVKDYRSQKQGSLTDAVFNMIDLLKNDDAAGWSPELKGFYDIEGDPGTAPTVAQASPLTMLATAVIANDEDFYLKKALPTIEYTISRSGYRWAKEIVPSGFNNSAKTLVFDPISSQFTTAYFEGLNQFTGNANHWISNLALPNGKVRTANGYSVTIPVWVQELAAYKLTGKSSWLNSAKTNADRYLTNQVYNNTVTPMGKGAFYNANFYAYWWDLLDLYEQTKDKKYLQAAELCAFQTIAGIKSVPQVRESNMTIHPANQYEGNTTLWWKNNEKYRLGFPRKEGDAPEKQVPQSLVSAVGLGFEQPFTYFEAGKTVRPVFMSSWAPHLLRLYQYTGREIFQTYARNAVIGRFTNYPGYYATGFTDITMKPDFPYAGPDVSSIYYHHISSHLAFSWDFLLAEAIQRSGNKISFPYAKQDGFVWFTNRLYGAGKGTIHDDKQVKLWMKKGLITLNSPEVNYITGISNDRFWVVLLSESNNELSVELKLDAATGVAANTTATLISGEKNRLSKLPLNAGRMNVSLNPKGMTAISFPLTKMEVSPAVIPLKDGMKVIDAGAPFGKIYMFRIRSPFGWDSIYGFSETSPIKGASVTIHCNGQTITKNEYPFEWSFYKLKTGEKANLTIQLQSKDQKPKEINLVLEGN